MAQTPVTQLIVKIDEFLETNPLTEVLDGETWFKYKLEGVGYDYDINDPKFDGVPDEETCPVVKLNELVADTLYDVHGNAIFDRHEELKTLSNGKYTVEPHTIRDDGSWWTGILITPKGRVCFG